MGARSNRSKLLWCVAAPWLVAACLELFVAGFDLAPARGRPMTIWTPYEDMKSTGPRATHRPSPGWLWEPVPGATIDGKPMNPAGYPGPELARERAGGLRMLVLGESAAFGLLVSDAESWPRRLEASLRTRGFQVEVQNLAVGGHTIAQGRARYRGLGREYAPDVVLACFGGVNEHWPAPGGMSDLGKIELVGSAAYATRELLERSAGARWLLSLGGQRTTLAADAGLRRVSMDEYRSLVLALCDDVRSDGAELVLVRPAFSLAGMATKPKATEYGELLSWTASEAGIPLADTHAAFRAREAELRTAPAAPDPLFFDDFHPTPAGHAIFAAEVERTLERAGLLARARAGAGADQ